MRVQGLKQLGVNVTVGDVANKAAVEAAVRGTKEVVHCAARIGAQGTWEEFYRDSVEGTENVMRAAHEAGVERVIYVSSLGVYGTPESGDCINDATPYDPRPDKRGNYSRAKVEAEKFVLEFAKESGLPVTIFRPGFIYGPGRPLPSAPLAFPSPLSTSFIVIGSSKTLLALNYIENLLDAFELALDRPESVGRQYIIVDDEQLTSGEYHRIREEIDGTHAAFIPSWPFRLASPGFEILARRSNGGKLASFSSYALARALKSVRYDTRGVREQLGWKPRLGLREALKASYS